MVRVDKMNPLSKSPTFKTKQESHYGVKVSPKLNSNASSLGI